MPQLSKLFALLLLLDPAGSSGDRGRRIETPAGYRIEADRIIFSYAGPSQAKAVYVVGNFMGWKRGHPDWRMSYREDLSEWTLELPLHRLTEDAAGSFLEFTFEVDGQLLDADADAPNTIYCPGHGRRYLIRSQNSEFAIRGTEFGGQFT